MMWLFLFIMICICLVGLRPLRERTVLRYPAFWAPAAFGGFGGLAFANMAVGSGVDYWWLPPSWMLIGSLVAGEAGHNWFRKLNK